MNSDEIVEALQPYGVVRVFQHDDKTWSAKADLFMHGMKAEVRSDFNHATMLAALTTLHHRVMEVVVTKDKLLAHD